MMPGITLQEICDAILDAYDDDELRTTVRTLMDVKLNNVVKPGAFGQRVFDFVEWAERRGREVELIQATARARPRNLMMQAVSKKYGLAVPVYVEKGGKAVPGAPADATDGGLEKLVRPHLSFTDFGLWRERMAQVEGRVCLVTINGAAQGTGFLVGPDAVLTNYHVMAPAITDTRKAADFECAFDFKKLADGSITHTPPVKLHPTDWLVDASPYSQAEKDGQPDRAEPTANELDYALVRLTDAVGGKPWAASPNSEGGAPIRGWLRVPEDLALKSPMGVLIAQHPGGSPLKLAVDTEAINQAAGLWLNKAGNRLRYATNTLNGSSGSPVFDLEWGLIALHHYGDPARGHPPGYNQGVPLHLIRKRLTAAGKASPLGGDPK
jgi:hypothetical protein